MKTSQSEALFERSLKVAPGGVHSPVRSFRGVGGKPLFFDRAQGAYLTSVDGEKFIDFCQNFGPNILGHRDADVSQAVLSTMEKIWGLGACEPYSLELAEFISQRLPWAQKVRFVCSGTEAVMSALRVARAATRRPYILKFDGCYHGHADSMLVKAGSGLAGRAASDSAGVSESVAQATLVAPLDDEEAVEKIFASSGEQIAAVILEPLPANFGLLIQREEFWRKVFSLAQKSGALLIFDEVISGFRVGFGGMAEALGVRPDLVTYGKIMGGGFPVGAYAGKAQYMDLVAPLGPVYQAGTLAASPVGAVAGLATLKKLVEQNVHATLEARTEVFCTEIESLFGRKEVPARVIRKASLFWLHFSAEKQIRSPRQFDPQQPENFRKFFTALLKHGLYLAPSPYEVNFMSLAHSENVLDQALGIVKKAIDEVF